MPMKHEISQVVVAAQDIPTNRMIFEDEKGERIDMNGSPTFSTKVVAMVFFGKSAHWLRWRSRDGFTVLDGVKVEPSRAASNIREYNLADIERLAHALRANDAITTEQCVNSLRTIAAVARLYGLA